MKKRHRPYMPRAVIIDRRRFLIWNMCALGAVFLTRRRMSGRPVAAEVPFRGHEARFYRKIG